MMDAYLFERCLIWLICQKAGEMSPPLTETEISKGVFDNKNPVNAWRSTRNTGRKLSLREAVLLAERIGMSFEALCWDAVNEIRRGWAIEQDVSRHKPQAGRPKGISKEKNNQNIKQPPAALPPSQEQSSDNGG